MSVLKKLIIVINKDFSKDIDKNSEGKMQYYFNNYNSDMAKKLRLLCRSYFNPYSHLRRPLLPDLAERYTLLIF